MPDPLKVSLLEILTSRKDIRFWTSNQKYFVSRDVKFFENFVPFSSLNDTSTSLFPHPATIVGDSDLIMNIVTNNISDLESENQPPDHNTITQPSPPITTSARPIRFKTVPNKFKDYVGVPKASTGTCLYPFENHISYNNLSSSYRAYISATSKISVTYNFAQAVKDPNWRAAMKTEIP